MKILTAKLKKWCVDNCDTKATAEDSEFRKAVGEAMAKSDDEKGYLSIEEYTKLSTTKDDDSASEFLKGQNDILEALTSIGKSLKTQDKSTEELEAEKKTEEEAATKKIQDDAIKKVKEEAAVKEAEAEAEKAAEKAVLAKKKEGYKPSQLEKAVMAMGGTPDEEDEEKGFDVRVKEAAESYSDTKSALTYPEITGKGADHPFAGQPVKDFTEGSGRIMDHGSELDKAVAGAWGKYMANVAIKKSKTIGFMSMPQHDKELIVYALQNMKWGGSTTGSDFADIDNRKLTPTEQKTLIDDAVSGGIEAAPIVFDDDVIQTPLLHGELFPLVNVVPISRGRRIEGVITGTVTGGWGGVDDTAIALFNTASYVSAFDTTIFRWEGAIRIGLDFLSDTPIDFNQHISTQYGERLLEDLDDVIATGDGTTQPEGIMNKTGATSIAFGAATTIGNYESLRFSVAKPEHRANLLNTAVFCGTETSYQRVRAIPVGAADARRLFGHDHFGATAGGYTFGTAAYKINESLTNQQIFYTLLGRYRMYRRRGFTMRTSTEGDTLIRRNSMLMVAMARYGGQAERGAVVGLTTTAPA